MATTLPLSPERIYSSHVRGKFFISHVTVIARFHLGTFSQKSDLQDTVYLQHTPCTAWDEVALITSTG